MGAQDNYDFREQSVLHLISATIMFLSGFAFLVIINYLYAYSRDPVISSLKFSRKFKIFCLIFPVAYQGASMVWLMGVSPSYRLSINVTGLGEWLSCFCLFIFVLTFSFDIHYVFQG